ncbi:MAG: methyltransferase domain-containing protein [Bacteroidales bacterium]
MEDAVKFRYSRLADDNCCLSCGGAMEKSGAAPGEICIDLGSGRGTDVIRLADIVGSKGFVYGVDATPEMVNKGRSAANKLGIDNVGFILSGLREIPLSSNLADLVISNCVINHVDRKDRVWMEIFRLLKKGGRFVISDIYSVEPVPDEYSSDPVAVAECWAGAVTRDEYLATIERAGFKQVRIIEESRPYEKGRINVCSFTVTGIKE